MKDREMELGSLLALVGKVQALVVHNDLLVGGLNIDELVMHVVLHMVLQTEHSLMSVYWSSNNAL